MGRNPETGFDDLVFHHPLCNFSTTDLATCMQCQRLYARYPLKSSNETDAKQETDELIKKVPDAKIIEKT